MKMDGRRKIIVAVTGASGSVYARLLCEALSRVAELGEIALIVTGNGCRVAAFEDGDEWLSDSRFTRYDDDDLFAGLMKSVDDLCAAPASGSASSDAMAVIPCTMGTVGRIASGVSDNLVCRAADVMLKERRRLILVTREAPLSAIHLHNLLRLTEAGAIVCPASPSFYSKPATVEQLCGTIVERVLSLLGVDAPHYEWGAER